MNEQLQHDIKTRNGWPLPEQRGAVLIVAMIMLVVLTMIGIVGMSSMTMEERMAVGYQQREVAFGASESVINTVMVAASPSARSSSTGEWVRNPSYTNSTNPLTTMVEGATGCDITSDLGGPVQIDSTGALGGGDVVTNVTIAYGGTNSGARHSIKGNQIAMGDDSSPVSHFFSITATSEYQIAGTRTAISSQTQVVKQGGPASAFECPVNF